MMATHEYVVPKSIPMTVVTVLAFRYCVIQKKVKRTRSSDTLVTKRCLRVFLSANRAGDEKRTDEDEEEVESGHPRSA